MPSLASMASERGKTIERIMSKITIQQLHYSKLKPSEKNFYRQCDIEDLADALIQAGRIMVPLIVVKTDIGEYEVISGHRRRNAAIWNVEKRERKEFEFLPCIVLNKEEIEKITDGMNMDYLEDYLEYILIITNSSSRDRNDYERMMEAIKLKDLIPKLRGDEELKGRALRAEIAKEMKRSTGSVGMYECIYKNLIGEWMQEFEADVIGVTVAAGLATLPAEKQLELVGRQITLNEIREIKEQIRQQEAVPNFDTEKNPLDRVNTRMEGHFEVENQEEGVKNPLDRVNTRMEGHFETEKREDLEEVEINEPEEEETGEEIGEEMEESSTAREIVLNNPSNDIEKGFHVCVQGMKGCYMCETFQVKDEYEAAEKIKRGILEQLFGNDLEKMEIRVTVNRV